jgi:hypothetical protein
MRPAPEQRPSPIRQRLYRGVDGLLAPFRVVDDGPAAAILPPAALALFRQMSPADRAHSLRVHQWLLDQGCDQRDLLAAGLIHDCGKAAARLAVWQRTLKVLLKKLAPGLWRRLSAPAAPDSWRYPFYILAEHARIGAEWAEAAGCSELTCWLIAHHESIIPRDHPYYDLQWALQTADASS